MRLAEGEIMNQKQLNQLPTWPQRQDSVSDQMTDLKIIANRLGFYDAADAIGQLIPRLPEIKCACYIEAYNKDGVWHDVDKTCVLDDGGDEFCIYAKSGMRKEACKYWRIVK